MRLLKYLTIILVLLNCPTRLNAQIQDSELYFEFAAKQDIDLSTPQGFKETIGIPGTNWGLVINPNYKPAYHAPGPIGWPYHVLLESDKHDYAILLPVIIPGAPITDGPLVGLGNIVIDEIQASHNDSDYDISKDVTIISKPDMSQYAMADTVVIYPVNLHEPFLGKYNNCIGVYLRKYAHPALLCKILLSDKGMANKDDAIKALLNSIRYGEHIRPDGEYMEHSPFNWGLFRSFDKITWKPGIISE